MRIFHADGRVRRRVWIAVGTVATAGAAVVAFVTLPSKQGAGPHEATVGSLPPRANTSIVGASTHRTGSTMTPDRSDSLARLPRTEDPRTYAAAVAVRLFDVSPAHLSRSEFVRFWWANLPTVVYSDGAAKGLTLTVQNGDAIDNLTHGWIPSQATWTAEAAEATVGRLRITSVSVPAYWIDAVSSGQFTDPGLHMERVTGVLAQDYGVGRRYSTTRPIVIDLALLCGPTQPGGCRLLAPQQPPGQAGS